MEDSGCSSLEQFGKQMTFPLLTEGGRQIDAATRLKLKAQLYRKRPRACTMQEWGGGRLPTEKPYRNRDIVKRENEEKRYSEEEHELYRETEN